MKKISCLLSIALAFTFFQSCKNANSPTDTAGKQSETVAAPQRIISLNDGLTEIVCALGLQNDLVGRDITSVYPEYAKDSVKSLGMVGSINFESILNLKPDLVIATKGDLSQSLEKQMKDAGIRLETFEEAPTVAGAKDRIEAVAKALNQEDKAKQLVQQIDADQAGIKLFSKKPKVLFIYARGAGTMMVAGDSTAMSGLIKIAGGENAFPEMTNFKPLTPEALIKGNPDVILMFDSGLQSLGGVDGLLKVPGVKQTNAGKNRAVISLDGALMNSFGPRVGQAALKLNQSLASYAK